MHRRDEKYVQTFSRKLEGKRAPGRIRKVKIILKQISEKYGGDWI
jgi:hypothetical protein